MLTGHGSLVSDWHDNMVVPGSGGTADVSEET